MSQTFSRHTVVISKHCLPFIPASQLSSKSSYTVEPFKGNKAGSGPGAESQTSSRGYRLRKIVKHSNLFLFFFLHCRWMKRFNALVREAGGSWTRHLPLRVTPAGVGLEEPWGASGSLVSAAVASEQRRRQGFCSSLSELQAHVICGRTRLLDVNIVMLMSCSQLLIFFQELKLEVKTSTFQCQVTKGLSIASCICNCGVAPLKYYRCLFGYRNGHHCHVFRMKH